MSNNNYLANLLKFNAKNFLSKESKIKDLKDIKERGKSLSSIHKVPDIITQLKPFPQNNFSQPLNLHKSSFTPSNKSKDIFQPNLLLPPKSTDLFDKKTIILD